MGRGGASETGKCEEKETQWEGEQPGERELGRAWVGWMRKEVEAEKRAPSPPLVFV